MKTGGETLSVRSGRRAIVASGVVTASQIVLLCHAEAVVGAPTRRATITVASRATYSANPSFRRFVAITRRTHGLTRKRPRTTFACARSGQGFVTMKGKGRPSFHLRNRSSLLRGAPVVTRLTRTMGFVEVSQSPGVQSSIGTPGEDVPDSPDVLPAPH